MEIKVLYEDTHIVAVYKPAGLVVHSDGKTKEPNLSDWMLEMYPETKDVGEPGRTANGEMIIRAGIVHRLDRETSGVMLLAKTQEGFGVLKEQFQSHTIQKTYHAFVYGDVKTPKGRIDRPIGRSSQDFRKWSAQRGARGELRDAITDYVVSIHTPEYSFVEVKPQTGRTHQIRVHFKAINHPLVADSLYAPGRDNTLGFTRLALHSYTISFIDIEGQNHTVSAEHPQDFTEALNRLQR